MDGDDPIRHIAVATFRKAHLLHHSFQLLLGQKSFNTLHQVLVGAFVTRYDPTHFRNHQEGILMVYLLEDRVFYLAELQAHETATTLQHTFCLF